MHCKCFPGNLLVINVYCAEKKLCRELHMLMPRIVRICKRDMMTIEAEIL